jgi:DNA-binding Lrp family transcriptional regulator
MTESSDRRGLDDLDRAILDELQLNSRISNVELARRVALSPPAIHARVRRLEQLGYIDSYVTRLDRERVGYDLLCFVSVTLQKHSVENISTFREEICQIPEVLECHHITGDHDYLLKVVIRNREDLERFLMDRLTPIPAVERIQTSLVLSEVKSTTHLPLGL